MRVVIETNVLVAGLLSASGPPGWIVEAVLAVAIAAASASVLVTGNLRHFPPRARRDVVVLTPREFIDRLEPDRP